MQCITGGELFDRMEQYIENEGVGTHIHANLLLYVSMMMGVDDGLGSSRDSGSDAEGNCSSSFKSEFTPRHQREKERERERDRDIE